MSLSRPPFVVAKAAFVVALVAACGASTPPEAGSFAAAPASSAPSASPDLDASVAALDATPWRSQAPGKCTSGAGGTPAPEMSAAVTEAARGTKKCFNRLLAQKPNVTGHVTVSLHINEDGSVKSVKLAQDDFHDDAMTACVVEKFTVTYPSPGTGCGATVQIPMNFVPSADAGMP